MKTKKLLQLCFMVVIIVIGFVVAQSAALPSFKDGDVTSAIHGGEESSCYWCGQVGTCPSKVSGHICSAGGYVNCIYIPQAAPTTCTNNSHWPCGTAGGTSGCQKYDTASYQPCGRRS